jgi:uncharacterized Zn finger protein
MAMAQFGRTWWGQRFLAALEEFTDPGRLARGRAYATNGRVATYTVEAGVVKAKVRGSVNPYYGVTEEPIYRIRIAITQFPANDWSRVIERIAARADLITKLLHQEMPDQIEEVFAPERLHLLPVSADDFDTDCTCPDWDNPCKHIAGVYYMLAAALDRDPLLLFALRGLSEDRLRAELVKSPLGKILASALTRAEPPVAPVESFYTRPTPQKSSSTASIREFWTGARRLPPQDSASQARVPALLVKKQGDYPPFWHKNGSFIAAMEDLYERVRTKSNQMR